MNGLKYPSANPKNVPERKFFNKIPTSLKQLNFMGDKVSSRDFRNKLSIEHFRDKLSQKTPYGKIPQK